MSAVSRWVALAALVLFPSCGGGDGGGTSPSVVSVRLEPRFALVVGAGDTARFAATVLDAAGGRVSGAPLAWSTANPGVATVDGQGLVRAVATGTTIVTATSGDASGTASVEVWVPQAVSAYTPGTSYFGRKSYVEYIPGELPLVISAAHGGSLTPEEIPDRTWGTTVTDSNTRETTLAVREAFLDRTGKAPHVVISHLRRTKLDPNREIGEAAQDNPFAELAWHEFQGFIDVATSTVAQSYGSGFYIDLHGHGHAIPRAELGYLLSSSQLNRSDAEMDALGLAAQSSIRALADESPLPFSQLLRGGTSLGGYLQAEGVRSVPSPSDASPGSDPYFSGGYNTDRHGSRAAQRTVSGVQIELHMPGIRDTDANRRAFGVALARATEAYMLEHFGFFRTRPEGVGAATGHREE